MLRKPSKVKPISLTEEESLKWKQLLFQYYRESGDTSEENILIEKIYKIIIDCQNSWERAPSDFGKRISMKTGWNSPLKARNQADCTEKIIEESKEQREESSLDISSSLSVSEKKFFDNRIREYKNDFDFNDSADLALLKRLVIEEIIHERLVIQHLNSISLKKMNISSIVEEALSGSHKRLTELQKQLGISRGQRADELNKGAESIAELSVSLDEKLKKFPGIRERLSQEEWYYINKKLLEEPVNIIPDEKQLDAIIGNFDSTKIYEGMIDKVLRDASKTGIVPDIAMRKSEDLPSGVDLS